MIRQASLLDALAAGREKLFGGQRIADIARPAHQPAEIRALPELLLDDALGTRNQRHQQHHVEQDG